MVTSASTPSIGSTASGACHSCIPTGSFATRITLRLVCLRRAGAQCGSKFKPAPCPIHCNTDSHTWRRGHSGQCDSSPHHPYASYPSCL
eukprot:4142895-Prymnesium_polylepis.1